MFEGVNKIEYSVVSLQLAATHRTVSLGQCSQLCTLPASVLSNLKLEHGFHFFFLPSVTAVLSVTAGLLKQLSENTNVHSKLQSHLSFD